ncbi:hypothetical protein CGZ93_02265 [Enemella dayhoffiae]|uniref:DUF4333 domain-containing protein n=1 Tax=Enemella dayhoffiae TaxID=2016507 RepID=A0A255HC72_9ACTN|nr:DUF4333 domain-containing protein [Enemella dayhoffiae]OYO25287.1 hypothetical protein CGZ93_02265 [Enemella dayhoffiae]
MKRTSIRLATAALGAALALSACTGITFQPYSGSPSSASSPAAAPTTRSPSIQPSPEDSASPEPGESPSPGGGSRGKVARIQVEVAIMNEVKDKTGRTVIVDCPADLDARVGTKMTCDWRDVDDKGRVEVEVISVDSTGQVNFRFRTVS